MNCKREPLGEKAQEMGVCPATMERRLDTVHGGKNAGRSCWAVAETLCEGSRQGTFTQKYEDCKRCYFYHAVKAEEGMHYMPSIILLSKIIKNDFAL